MSVATSYARAIFEAAQAEKSGSDVATFLDQVEKALEEFDQTLKTSKELTVALMGPVTTSKEKVLVVGQLSEKMGHSPLVRQSLQMMARKNRLTLLAEIREALLQLKLRAAGALLGRVESAEPLSAGAIEDLAQAFSKKLGMPVKFQVSTDPALMAGVRVTVNGVTYDGSLRSQLARLRDRVLSVPGAGI